MHVDSMMGLGDYPICKEWAGRDGRISVQHITLYGNTN